MLLYNYAQSPPYTKLYIQKLCKNLTRKSANWEIKEYFMILIIYTKYTSRILCFNLIVSFCGY